MKKILVSLVVLASLISASLQANEIGGRNNDERIVPVLVPVIIVVGGIIVEMMDSCHVEVEHKDKEGNETKVKVGDGK